MLTDPISDIKRTTLKDQVYDAYVINNTDPKVATRGFGFVQIRIPGLHRGWTDAQLPWAKQHEGFGPSGNISGMGDVKIPANYTKVSVRFLDDEGYHPIYEAAPRTTDMNIPGLTDDPDFPNVSGSVDSVGNLLKHNFTQKTSAFTHGPSGAGFSFDASGNLVVNCSNLTFNVNGSLLTAVSGELMLGAQGAAHLIGSSANLDSGTINFNGSTFGPVPTGSGSGAASATAPTALVPRAAPSIPNMQNQTDL